MIKQQAGAASEFIFTGYSKLGKSSRIYCSLLFLQLQDVMGSTPHWDSGVLDSMPKQLETKLGSQTLSYVNEVITIKMTLLAGEDLGLPQEYSEPALSIIDKSQQWSLFLKGISNFLVDS